MRVPLARGMLIGSLNDTATLALHRLRGIRHAGRADTSQSCCLRSEADSPGHGPLQRVVDRPDRDESVAAIAWTQPRFADAGEEGTRLVQQGHGRSKARRSDPASAFRTPRVWRPPNTK